jgi:diguanylate cyclase (GGDEF)-like protein/PAS domain S-box-containing protein
MRKRRYGVLLISALSLLVVLIIIISMKSISSLDRSNSLFDKAYNVSFSIEIAAQQANTDVIALHSAMKDVALSDSTSDFDKAMADTNTYDTDFNNDINYILSKKTDTNLVKNVISAYNDWIPIREQTINYVLQGDIIDAANITATSGAAQVAIIQAQMNILINHEKSNTQNYCNALHTESKNSEKNLIIILIIAILLGLSVSIYVIIKLSNYEKRLHFEKENFKITLHSIGDGIITADMDRKVTMLNSVAETLTGWKSSDALGRNFLQVFNIRSEESGGTVKDPVEEVILLNKVCKLQNHTVLTSADGTQRRISDSAAPIKDSLGNTIGVVMVFREITEKQISMEKIKHLIFHDGLTGLFNRNYFERVLEHLDKPSQLPISIINGDVNGLKLLNDVYGHRAGDELLKEIALILKKCCSEKDVVTRWGGDEFVIIMPNTTYDEANIVCDNIHTACENTALKSIILSISLGVSTKKLPSEDIFIVQKDAEEKMYKHKLIEGKGVHDKLISSLQNTLLIRNSEEEEHVVRISQVILAKILSCPSTKWLNSSFSLFFMTSGKSMFRIA